MSYSVLTPHKTGTISSVSNNVLTVTASGDNVPAAADISRSDASPTTQPRLLVIVDGDARGQYRKIIAQTATTYTLDYPMNISAYRGETYSNGDAVTEVNPSNGDTYVLTRTWKEVYDLAPDGDLTWLQADAIVDTGNQQRYELRAAENASSSQRLDIGGASAGQTCIIYDENVTVKVRMNRFRLYPITSSEIRGGLIHGYTNPGFSSIDHYVSSTQTNVTAGQLVQDDDGSLYKAINNVNNVDTSTDFTTSDWTDALNSQNGFTEYGCTFIDTHNSNSGTETMGPAWFNGGQIICDPITTDEGPWTITSDNRTFWRWFGSGSVDWIMRMWEVDVVGPIGGRFKGQQSILLDTTFRTGGQPLGSFNPASDGGNTYFGLIKGCTWDGKSQGLYVWFDQGPQVEVESPVFRNITTQLVRLGAGSQSGTDYLRLRNFDVTQLTQRTAFGDSSVTFINNNDTDSNQSASVDITQEVDIAYTDANLDDITDRTLKLAYTDSQDNNATAVESSTSAFDTQDIVRWDIDPITAGNINFSDGTDYGPYDFIIVSYEDNNLTFQEGLDGPVDSTRLVTSDSKVTLTRAQVSANTFLSVDSTTDGYDAFKYHKYVNPYDGGVTTPLIMDMVDSELVFNDDTVSARDVEFRVDSLAADAVTFGTNLRMHIASDNRINTSTNVGASNDIDVADIEIGDANLTCDNLVNTYSGSDVEWDGTGSVDGTVTLADGVTITIKGGFDITNTVFTTSGTDTATIIVENGVGAADAAAAAGDNVSILVDVTVTLELNENYTSDDDIEVRWAGASSIATYNSATKKDKSDSDLTITADNDNQEVDLTFRIPSDEGVYAYVSYRGYEHIFWRNQTENVSLEMSAIGGGAIDFGATYSGDDATLDGLTPTVGSNVSGSAWTNATEEIHIVVPSGDNLSCGGNVSREFIWKAMSDDKWGDAVIADYIPNRLWGFSATTAIINFQTGSGTEGARMLGNFSKTSDSDTISFDTRVQNIDETDLRTTISPSNSLTEVRFAVNANGASGTEVENIIESILNERDMTKTNQERLGKLQPINVS